MSSSTILIGIIVDVICILGFWIALKRSKIKKGFTEDIDKSIKKTNKLYNKIVQTDSSSINIDIEKQEDNQTNDK